jgi:hypothetical protein
VDMTARDTNNLTSKQISSFITRMVFLTGKIAEYCMRKTTD